MSYDLHLYQDLRRVDYDHKFLEYIHSIHSSILQSENQSPLTGHPPLPVVSVFSARNRIWRAGTPAQRRGSGQSPDCWAAECKTTLWGYGIVYYISYMRMVDEVEMDEMRSWGKHVA